MGLLQRHGAWVAASLLWPAGCVDRAIAIDDLGVAETGDVDTGDAPDDLPNDDEPGVEPECIPGQPACPCPDGTVAQGDACVAPGEQLVALSPTSQVALASGAVEQPPAVQLLASDGSPLSSVEIVFSVTEGEGGALVVGSAFTDASGVATTDTWILGQLSGQYTVSASVPSYPQLPPVVFAAQTEGDFEITLEYVAPVTAEQEAAFEFARRRWQGILLNAQPEVMTDAATLGVACGYETSPQPLSVRGVHIFVRLGPIDGSGSGGVNILGQAGPCVLRDNGSPTAGGMTFDTADLDMIAATGKLETVILHEMGHVLGVGSLWGGLVVDPSIPDAPGVDTHFVGQFGQAAFVDLIGALQYGGAIVPVENNATPGSSDGHWRENVLTTELMTPNLGDVSLPTQLSILTIASMLDLGYYEVNPYPADPYRFVSQQAPVGPEAAVVLTDEVLRPRAVIAPDGTLTPL
jgi:hypothetical protein